MKALLLAAGTGARLQPLTQVLPKCLMPIHGIPLLLHWIDLLQKNGISNILINLHYLPQLVEETVRATVANESIIFACEEELLGTGGTILNNLDFLDSEDLLIIHADNLSNFDLADFIKAHRKRPSSCHITMLTFHSDEPQNCGILDLNDHGIVEQMHEKQKKFHGNIANGAVYIIDRQVTAFLQSLGKKLVDFSRDILPAFMGKVGTYFNDRYHRDIGNPQALLRAQLEYPYPAPEGMGSLSKKWTNDLMEKMFEYFQELSFNLARNSDQLRDDSKNALLVDILAKADEPDIAKLQCDILLVREAYLGFSSYELFSSHGVQSFAGSVRKGRAPS